MAGKISCNHGARSNTHRQVRKFAALHSLPARMIEMNVGEQRCTVVFAKPYWNLTGIQLGIGEQYSMYAAGRWVDWYIPHGPEGDPSSNFYMRAFEGLRRMKDENWFELIGALDSKISTAFPIGKGCEYTAQRGGELTCFANDVKGFYFNNYGHVTLTVTRIA